MRERVRVSQSLTRENGSSGAREGKEGREEEASSPFSSILSPFSFSLSHSRRSAREIDGFLNAPVTFIARRGERKKAEEIG